MTHIPQPFVPHCAAPASPIGRPPSCAASMTSPAASADSGSAAFDMHMFFPSAGNSKQYHLNSSPVCTVCALRSRAQSLWRHAVLLCAVLCSGAAPCYSVRLKSRLKPLKCVAKRNHKAS